MPSGPDSSTVFTTCTHPFPNLHIETATAGTPLAPSVEKAYYRKCIALKRRLNEVEAANDEAKVRRVRLDRAIMKMRLERAFLLDELRRRMDVNVDGSDGSGDEGMATPPQDRPHRDKRRRQHGNAQPSGHESTNAERGAQEDTEAGAGAADAPGNAADGDEEDERSHAQPGTSRNSRSPSGRSASRNANGGHADDEGSGSANGDRRLHSSHAGETGASRTGFAAVNADS